MNNNISNQTPVNARTRYSLPKVATDFLASKNNSKFVGTCRQGQKFHILSAENNIVYFNAINENRHNSKKFALKTFIDGCAAHLENSSKDTRFNQCFQAFVINTILDKAGYKANTQLMTHAKDVIISKLHATQIETTIDLLLGNYKNGNALPRGIHYAILFMILLTTNDKTLDIKNRNLGQLVNTFINNKYPNSPLGDIIYPKYYDIKPLLVDSRGYIKYSLKYHSTRINIDYLDINGVFTYNIDSHFNNRKDESEHNQFLATLMTAPKYFLTMFNNSNVESLKDADVLNLITNLASQDQELSLLCYLIVMKHVATVFIQDIKKQGNIDSNEIRARFFDDEQIIDAQQDATLEATIEEIYTAVSGDNIKIANSVNNSHSYPSAPDYWHVYQNEPEQKEG
jgi:hypothetical protein